MMAIPFFFTVFVVVFFMARGTPTGIVECLVLSFFMLPPFLILNGLMIVAYLFVEEVRDNYFFLISVLFVAIFSLYCEYLAFSPGSIFDLAGGGSPVTTALDFV